MDWALIGLLLGLIGVVVGAAWRFGKVEKGIANLEKADAQLRADVQGLDQRLSSEIREVRQEVRDVRQDVREVRQDVLRILERLAPPAVRGDRQQESRGNRSSLVCRRGWADPPAVGPGSSSGGSRCRPGGGEATPPGNERPCSLVLIRWASLELTGRPSSIGSAVDRTRRARARKGGFRQRLACGYLPTPRLRRTGWLLLTAYPWNVPRGDQSRRGITEIGPHTAGIWTHTMPSTCLKCRSADTRSAPVSMACAAIQTSLVGMGRPLARKEATIRA